jgi:hypothetical protein
MFCQSGPIYRGTPGIQQYCNYAAFSGCHEMNKQREREAFRSPMNREWTRSIGPLWRFRLLPGLSLDLLTFEDAVGEWQNEQKGQHVSALHTCSARVGRLIGSIPDSSGNASIISHAAFFLKDASRMEKGCLAANISSDQTGEKMGVLREKRQRIEIEGPGYIRSGPDTSALSGVWGVSGVRMVACFARFPIRQQRLLNSPGLEPIGKHCLERLAMLY